MPALVPMVAVCAVASRGGEVAVGVKSCLLERVCLDVVRIGVLPRTTVRMLSIACVAVHKKSVHLFADDFARGTEMICRGT